MNLTVACNYCGRTFELLVNEEDYKNWSERGMFAQTAFPYLTPDKRELLISRTCGDCWDMMFPEEEE